MKNLLVLLAVLVLMGAWASPAEAKKSCHCWIGLKKGQELKNYGTIARYRDTESRKKAKCSEACAQRCAGDLADPQRLCQWIGGDFDRVDRIGCFSVVGRKDNENNTWDFDGRPRPFPGCSRCCKCDRGWYDKNRRSCVVGADCSVPGMPVGDKGGGYFAWDQKLFKNIPGARCKTVAGPCPKDPPKPMPEWTGWLDRDNPGGNGDYETLSHFIQSGQACDQPRAVECRTKPGKKPWQETGLVYQCTPQLGGVCLNREQKRGTSCVDFEVRFLCPKK